MEYIITIVTSVVAAVLAFIVKSLMNDNKRLRQSRREVNEKKETSIQEGLTSLLRVQLIEYHERYMEKGSMPSYAYENWEKMFKAYRGLGGNGMLLQMNKDIRGLEFRKQEEHHER